MKQVLKLALIFVGLFYLGIAVSCDITVKEIVVDLKSPSEEDDPPKEEEKPVVEVPEGEGTAIPAEGAVPESFYLPTYEITVTDAYPVSGTWTLAGSPYRVSADIYVKKGTSLVIEPGVVVEFQGKYSLRLLGGITAKGTSDKPIVFTTTAEDIARGDEWIGWTGIRICGHEYDGSYIDHGIGMYTFEHCEIAYVDKRCEDKHPWENRYGSVYTHGASNTDLAFNDNYVHHGRSCLFSFFGVSRSNMSGDMVLENNVFEYASVNSNVSASHVYRMEGETGPYLKTVIYKGGAIKNYLDIGVRDPEGRVASAWDAYLTLQGVEVINCGDESGWFDQMPAGAIQVIP